MADIAYSDHKPGTPLGRASTHPISASPNPTAAPSHRSRFLAWDSIADQSGPTPFIGRLGGNQQFVLDRSDPRNGAVLEDTPDAAPYMKLHEQMDLRPFRSVGLWKAAIIEGMGSLMLVYITIWSSLSPGVIPTPPSAQFGNFDNAAFIGPVVGSLTNFLVLTLFTIAFGGVTGAHLNPTITFATFCVRLCSLPRCILYIGFQVGGAGLGGLLIRASYGSTDFKAGGCWLFPEVVPAGDAFVVELFSCLTLLFLAFGVGLDPRQKAVIAPSLAPFLVGLSLGALTLATGFTRYGYGGASMNPARCFGAFAGSSFPVWHWHHWAADFIAGIVHGLFYFFIPPWQQQYDQ